MGASYDIQRWGSAPQDETWADEGSGFASIELPNLPGIRVGLGICMDINPYQFKGAGAPFCFSCLVDIQGLANERSLFISTAAGHDMAAPFEDYEFANFHKQVRNAESKALVSPPLKHVRVTNRAGLRVTRCAGGISAHPVRLGVVQLSPRRPTARQADRAGR